MKVIHLNPGKAKGNSNSKLTGLMPPNGLKKWVKSRESTLVSDWPHIPYRHMHRLKFGLFLNHRIGTASRYELSKNKMS